MHSSFHRHPSSAEEAEGSGATRFYRWHIDAALYALHPPVVTTLLALQVRLRFSLSYFLRPEQSIRICS